MLPRRVFLEGRCRQCGWRVTVDRDDSGHSRNGRWCGPVETEHPFVVRDDTDLRPIAGPASAAAPSHRVSLR